MIQAVIFDLDGVIVSTDEQHYRAWKRLADEQGIGFDREINHRLRGVSRMASLQIVLERADQTYDDAAQADMAARKNDYYRQMLAEMSPQAILPGVMALLQTLRERGVKLAIASSSRNTPYILERIGLDDFFDAVADGNDITHSKPHPQVFLLAAERLGVAPQQCLVVEDARAGVEAALAGEMKVLGVGDAAGDDRAHATAADLSAMEAKTLLNLA